MATPDFVRSASATGGRALANRVVMSHGSADSTKWGLPSLRAAVWSMLDMATIVICAAMAARYRNISLGPVSSLHAWHKAIQLEPTISITMLLWYMFWFVFLSNSYGLYRSFHNRSKLNEMRLTVQSSVMAGLIVCGTIYLSRNELVSRLVVVATVGLSCFALCLRRSIWRSVVQHRFEQGIDTRNVLVVGIGRTAQALRHHLESIRHLGYSFKGFVTDEAKAPEPLRNVVVGGMENLLAVARANFVEEIFICTHCGRAELLALVEEAAPYGINIRLVPDLYDGLTWHSQMEFIGNFPTVPLHHHEFPLLSYIAKRSLDLVLSIAALVALSPVLLAIALGIKLGSPGPVFYCSNRIGRKGKSFLCLKFRTMVEDADQIRSSLEHMNEREGVLFKISNDPRVTRIGAILRKYSLDELPQFINVLMGEMSIVGPRPPIASEVAQYDLSHLRRLDVLPGITGLWQVEARQDPSFDSYISLDTAYVENWSLWMDIKILLRTVSVVFSGTGA